MLICRKNFKKTKIETLGELVSKTINKAHGQLLSTREYMLNLSIKIVKILTYTSYLEKSVNFHITYKSHIIDKSHIVDKSQEQKKQLFKSRKTLCEIKSGRGRHK